MDGNLVMKSSSFNVKDILDLPTDAKLACSPVAHETTTTGSFRTIPNIPDIPAVDYGYDASDNPYARWLQNNASDVMQYTRTLLIYHFILLFAICKGEIEQQMNGVYL